MTSWHHDEWKVQKARCQCSELSIDSSLYSCMGESWACQYNANCRLDRELSRAVSGLFQAAATIHCINADRLSEHAMCAWPILNIAFCNRPIILYWFPFHYAPSSSTPFHSCSSSLPLPHPLPAPTHIHTAILFYLCSPHYHRYALLFHFTIFTENTN